MKKTLCLVSCMLALGACGTVPSSAYYNRGDPENLVDVSSEVVNVSLSSHASLKELADVLKDDRPSRAELHCALGAALCAKAKNVLDEHGVASRFAGGNTGVDLIYERVTARDCEHRYINNSSNHHNLPPPTFGCSITSNMAQMVTDKRQFTSPSLTDVPDAGKAAQVYDTYRKPASADAEDDNSSLLQSVTGGQ